MPYSTTGEGNSWGAKDQHRSVQREKHLLKSNVVTRGFPQKLPYSVKTWSRGNSRVSLKRGRKKMKQASELEGIPDRETLVQRDPVLLHTRHRAMQLFKNCKFLGSELIFSWHPTSCAVWLQVLYTKQGKHHSNHHWFHASGGSHPEDFFSCQM